jgi:hypothetical protein
MYKQERGVKPPTFADLVSRYRIVKLFNDFPLDLDQDLLRKIAALKDYINTTQDTYHQTLLTTCEVLEQKYKESIQGLLISFIISLYDTKPEDVKYNTEHKCPYRWYAFKALVQPCINKQKANETLQQLNTLYKDSLCEPIQLTLTDDCTQNAYELLDYIKHMTLPKPVPQYAPEPYIVRSDPQYAPEPVPEQSACTGLYDFLIAVENFIDSRGTMKQHAFADLVPKFNNLCPKAAYIFNTQFVIFRNRSCKSLRGNQTVGVGQDPCQTHTETIDLEDYRNRININDNKRGIQKKGLKGMDWQAFYDKANAFGKQYEFLYEKKYSDTNFQIKKYGGARRRTRKLRS